MTDAMDPGGHLLAAATAFGLGLIAILLASRRSQVRSGVLIARAAYIGHIIYAFSIYYSVRFLFPDESRYDELGQQVSQNVFGGSVDPIPLGPGKEGWVWLLAVFYRIFGHVPEVGLAFNALMMALIPIFIGNASVHIGWPKSGRIAAILAAIPPPFILWGSPLLREGTALALTSCALHAASRFYARPRIGAVLQFAATLLILSFIRGTAALILAVAVPLALVLAGRAGRSTVSVPRKALVVVAAVAAYSLLQFGSTSLGWSLDQANASKAATARDATSAIGQVAAVNSESDAVTSSITSLPTVALGPFPWQWTLNPVGILTAIDALSWYVFLYFAWVAWRQPQFRRGRWLAVIPPILFLMAISLTTGAFGSIVRYRAMALPFIILLAAAGLEFRRSAARDKSHSGKAMTADKLENGEVSRRGRTAQNAEANRTILRSSFRR